MLVKIKFNNFKSFSSETVIDLAPSKIEYLKDANIFNNILKGCAFYGANASGKTNALNAITLLLDLLFKNYTVQIDLFSRFTKSNTMSFTYVFKPDANVYLTYEIEFHKTKGITKELLYENDKMLLNRVNCSAKSYITENEDYDSIDPNTLFLKTIYFNTGFVLYPCLKKEFDFLKKSIYFNPIRSVVPFVSFDASTNREIFLQTYLDKYGEKDINDFLERFNFSFRIEYTKTDVGNIELIPFANRLRIKRKNLSPIPFYLESLGNKILLNFLPSYLMVIKNGGILAVDEFSSGFHNDLEELLVKYFYENSTESQLFFVSHSTNILKTSIIRPDQVFAVDFDDNGSVLNKFSSNSMRESQNMEKMYLAGAFGGVPLYERN